MMQLHGIIIWEVVIACGLGSYMIPCKLDIYCGVRCREAQKNSIIIDYYKSSVQATVYKRTIGFVTKNHKLTIAITITLHNHQLQHIRTQ